MKSLTLLSFAGLAVAANEATKTQVTAEDVIHSLEEGTLRQERNIKDTTARLRALQEHVAALFPSSH